jgi:CDP-diacylglycerol---serine O-phosphatidyltransferase
MKKTSAKPWYRFVPSLFTSLNLVCGIIATYLSLEGRIDIAIVLMFIAAFFDFIDGFAARLLKVCGDFGKELDSLADLISFGLVPGAMLFFIQKTSLVGDSVSLGGLSFIKWIFLLVPILIPVFSALRLAKFNIDERQKSEFIGLPTPANALFFASLCYSFASQPESFLNKLNNPILISISVLLFSYLLVSEIPLFALKFSSFGWKKNALRYIFLIISLALIVLFKIPGFTGVIILYILLSVMRNIFRNRKILETAN